MDRQNSFVALGSESKTAYLIRYDRVFNVISDRHGPLCAVASHVPIYDQMLAQKLLIETDEQEYLRVANRGLRVNPSERILEFGRLNPACGLRIETSDNFDWVNGEPYEIDWRLIWASGFLIGMVSFLVFG